MIRKELFNEVGFIEFIKFMRDIHISGIKDFLNDGQTLFEVTKFKDGTILIEPLNKLPSQRLNEVFEEEGLFIDEDDEK